MRPNWPTSGPRRRRSSSAPRLGRPSPRPAARRHARATCSGWPRSRAPSCTAKRCRWTPTAAPGWTSWASPSTSRCGIVAAITPFNYPALLVMHKLAPALAAGNAVVLKPARTTPLTALALARCFTDAGLPDGVLSVLTGSGGTLGDALVSDPRVRKVSFTGSTTHRGTHHPGRRDQEAVPGAGLLLPGGGAARRRHRARGGRGRGRRVRQRRPGLHLRAARHHPPRDPRRLPRRAGAQGGGHPHRRPAVRPRPPWAR